jgi:hypothetical protein
LDEIHGVGVVDGVEAKAHRSHYAWDPVGVLLMMAVLTPLFFVCIIGVRVAFGGGGKA